MAFCAGLAPIAAVSLQKLLLYKTLFVGTGFSSLREKSVHTKSGFVATTEQDTSGKREIASKKCRL